MLPSLNYLCKYLIIFMYLLYVYICVCVSLTVRQKCNQRKTNSLFLSSLISPSHQLFGLAEIEGDKIGAFDYFSLRGFLCSLTRYQPNLT